MAHEIKQFDNMFSVNETPWHGLGTVLPDAPGIDEGIVYAGLDWKMRKLDLFAKSEPVNGFSRSIELPQKALQRADTGEVFTVVSDRYSILQNTEAFEVFRPLVDDGQIRLETAGSLKNGRVVWILARAMEAGPEEIREGDSIVPFTLLSNSHDGTQAVRFGFTPIRVVCNNTLSYAIDDDQSQLMRIYHRGDVSKTLEEVRGFMDVRMASWKKVADTYRIWAEKYINQDDLEKYIRLVFKKDISEPSKIEENVLEILRTGKVGGQPEKPTLWDAYNAVNEFLVWERGESADNRLDSAWFGDGKRIDQRAFEIADEWLKAA